MIGQTISHYRVLAKLGQGGMGVVYVAEDSTLGRKVALKVLPGAVSDNPARLQRFRREAKAVAALNHPNIVTIHSIEESEGARFMTMELVEGDSLDKVLPVDGLPTARVIEVGMRLAEALAAAHDKGITHRDLKPANVMITPEGRVKVLDFGLAKLAASVERDVEPGASEVVTESGAALTGEGVVMGTAPYMSPEQLQAQAVDHRTDIFSLGIMLYEMATGKRPFQGTSGLGLASSILKDAPPPLTEVRPGLPRQLGRIVHHCLEKDPQRRFQSALDVRNELEELGEEIRSGPVENEVETAPGALVRASSRPLPSAEISGPGSATSPDGPTSAAAPTAGAARRGPWAAVGALLVIVAVATAWWVGRSTEKEGPGPGGVDGEAPSVAVLPFADLSEEKDQEHFTDGMTEELLQALGKIEGLKVPSRTAVFALKGKGLGIEQVGERLGVETVLEGSVRKAGNRLRISTQLVQVSDGFTLWSNTYDRELEDVFAVQGEIASSIANALRLTLSPAAKRAAEMGGTDNTEAYDSYLRGRRYREQGTPEGRKYALQMYERAIALDPDYALAWMGVASSHLALHHYAGGDPADLEAADRASAKALALAPEFAPAHVARALYLDRAGDTAAAESEFREAIRLDPRSSGTYYSYGTMLYRQGDMARTAELWEKSIELDPETHRAINLLPQLYTSLGREADAQRAYRRVLEWATRELELRPDATSLRLAGANSLLALGQREEAFQWAQAVLERAEGNGLLLYNLSCFYSLAGEVGQALDTLERSLEAGKTDAEWLRQDSDLDNIRDDPRFQEILKRMEARGEA